MNRPDLHSYRVDGRPKTDGQIISELTVRCEELKRELERTAEFARGYAIGWGITLVAATVMCLGWAAS